MHAMLVVDAARSNDCILNHNCISFQTLNVFFVLSLSLCDFVSLCLLVALLTVLLSGSVIELFHYSWNAYVYRNFDLHIFRHVVKPLICLCHVGILSRLMLTLYFFCSPLTVNSIFAFAIEFLLFTRILEIHYGAKERR